MGEWNLEKSKERYARLADHFGFIVEKVLGSGQRVPEETVRQWRMLAVSICVLNRRLDEKRSAEERAAFSSGLETFLSGRSQTFLADPDSQGAAADVRALLPSLSDADRARFLRSLGSLLQVTERSRREISRRKFVGLMRREGSTTSELFTPFIPERFRAHARYPRLLSVLSTIGSLGETYDALADLTEDRRSGKVVVPDDFLTRWCLRGAIALDLAKLAARDPRNFPAFVNRFRPSRRRVFADGADAGKRDQQSQAAVRSARYTVPSGA